MVALTAHPHTVRVTVTITDEGLTLMQHQTQAPRTTSPSLLTDRYELTMLSSFVADGTAGHRAVFETFARRLPAGRQYGLLAGLGRLLDLVEDFTFDPDEIEWLLSEGVIGAGTATYLRNFRFRGDIDGLREGDLYFPGTPVLTVSGTLGECVILETLILSVLNHDTAVASAAARMVTAAGGTPEQGGRPIIEMGSRRTHEAAAVSSARAAYIAGFGFTSNLAAGRIYEIPTVGTAAHAFTLAHRTELDAFRSQVATHGAGTTLLVDTYDIAQGITRAVAATREIDPTATGPGAVRLDSGDLAEEAHNARALLDTLGAHDTRVTVTSDLDEYLITALADSPIDGYGAGTRVVTGSGHPTAGMVYKLVAIADEPGPLAPMRPVEKKAAGKGSAGGRKQVWRSYGTDGRLSAEIHAVDNALISPDADTVTHLAQIPLVRGGDVVHNPPLRCVREHAARALASLPENARGVADGDPAIHPVVVTPTTAPRTAPLPQEV